MNVAASNINNKIHPLFPKQWFIGARVTSIEREILGGMTQTCF